MNDLWNKLSRGARLLAEILARSYQYEGRNEFSLNNLRELTHMRSRTIVQLLGELASRGYGVVSKDEVNPTFIINRPRFETIVNAGRLPKRTE